MIVRVSRPLTNRTATMFKILAVLSIASVALAQYGGHGGGSGHHDDKADYYAHPHYQFEYSVHDPHTHDVKSQHESRDGDVVKGYYTVKEADGTVREVHYTADHKNGFNAEVKRTGHAHHPQDYHRHHEAASSGHHY